MNKYRARCIGHYTDRSQEKGTPYVAILFQTQFALDDPDERPNVKQLRWDGWLTEKAHERTFDTLFEVFGWNGNDTNELNGTGILEGIEANLVTEFEEYQDQKTGEVKRKERVVFVNPIYMQKTAGDAIVASSIAEEVKPWLLLYRQKKAGQTPPTPPKAASQPRVNVPPTPAVHPQSTGGDDLPF